MTEPVRLQRFLASAGVAARRKAEVLIAAGRVTVNGQIVRELGSKVDPVQDQVEVDGQAVVALDFFYVLLNKPKGCITAVSDDRGRPTVMDYLPNLPVPVKPVGRLDFYTEGVLLLTNDGELAARLLSAANHVPKTYHAKVHGTVTPEQLKQLRTGIQLEDGTVTQPADVALLPSDSKHSWVALTIFEGKYHQVHRMFEALGFRVDKLQRVAFATLTFHNLRVGDARELTQQELNGLRDTVGLDHGPVARGRWRVDREDTDLRRHQRAERRALAEAAAAPGATPAVEHAPKPEPRPDDQTTRYRPGNNKTTRIRTERDDRGPARRDDRGPARRDDRGPARRDDRGPARRDDRGPARRDDRGPARRDDRGPARRDDRGPRSNDRPARRDDRGPARRDDRGPARRDDRGPARRDDRGPARRDERGPARRDDRGPARRDDRGPARRDDRGPRSDDRPARRDDQPARGGQGRSFGKRGKPAQPARPGQPARPAQSARSAPSSRPAPHARTAKPGRPSRPGKPARPAKRR